MTKVNIKKATEIANEIANILPESYKNEMLLRAPTINDIDHDEDFWNEYKEACVEGFERITGKDFGANSGQKAFDLLEKAEEILFANKLQLSESKPIVKKSLK